MQIFPCLSNAMADFSKIPQHPPVLSSRPNPKSTLHASGLANLSGQRNPLPINIRTRPLHILAQRGNGDLLPVLNGLHDLKELACRAGSIHVASNVWVVYSALLKDADAVMVGTKAIVLILEGFGDCSVG